MFNFLCTLQYNGKNFFGWAKQQHAKTIQGEIERAILRVTKDKNFKTIGASKTDSGVHALDQKMLLVLNFNPSIEQFRFALNSILKPDIYIKSIVETDDSFRVRSCVEKEYEYVINIGEYNLYQNDFEWRITYPFNVEKYSEAIQLFIGEHDFTNFSGLSKKELNDIRTLRTIKDIVVSFDGTRIITKFIGKGFIRYQIRMIVGACAAYAIGKIKNIADIKNVLELKKDKFNHIADPAGLILKKITY